MSKNDLGRCTSTMSILRQVATSCFVYGALLFSVVFRIPFSLSKQLREAYFARFLLPIGVYLAKPEVVAVRRKVLSYLDDLVSHDAALRKEGAIRVLEIGAGFGPNIEFMTRKVKYWNVDPNSEFDDFLRKNLENNAANVEMEQWIHEYAEDMPGVPDDHFDVVLISHLLCSVSNVGKVLSECKRVLTKGGRLVFLEHVAHSEGSWRFYVQKLLDPFWSFTLCGCHLTRRTGQVLQNAGFDRIELHEAFLSVPSILSHRVYGFAVVDKN